MQKGFNRGRSGGRKRGSETPPTPMSGTPTPSPEAHWLGRGGGPPGTVSMHTHSELEKNEEVRGLSRNQGSQGGHPRGRSSRECRRHRGEASVGFGGEARGAWAGGWSGCCSHTSPEGWEGQRAHGWSSGAGVTRGHLRLQDSLPSRTFCHTECILCLQRPVWQPPALCGRGDTECSAVFPFNLFQPK